MPGEIGGVNEQYSLDLTTLSANLQAAESRAFIAERRVAALEQRAGAVEARVVAATRGGGFGSRFAHKMETKFKRYSGRLVRAGAGLVVANMAEAALPAAWAEPLGDVASYTAYGAMMGGGPGAVAGALVGTVKAVYHSVKKHEENLKQIAEKLKALDERSRELSEQVREERRKRREQIESVVKREMAHQIEKDKELFYQAWMNRPKD